MMHTETIPDLTRYADHLDIEQMCPVCSSAIAADEPVGIIHVDGLLLLAHDLCVYELQHSGD